MDINKDLQPTGISSIDDLAHLSDAECTLERYVSAVSEYVRDSGRLRPGPKKAGQIRLSNALGRALAAGLKAKLPDIKLIVGERKVSGALRTTNADVSEIRATDGLRLAVELKPVNLAVGRALWNRFGDIRTFAVNLHLKFPFCVVGGVLVIPTYEEFSSGDVVQNPGTGVAESEMENESPSGEDAGLQGWAASRPDAPGRKSTLHLIGRAIARLTRAGGRKTEGDAPHLLEGIAVVVYDPDKGEVLKDVPPSGSGLRWEEFIDSLVSAYQGRFEEP